MDRAMTAFDEEADAALEVTIDEALGDKADRSQLRKAAREALLMMVCALEVSDLLIARARGESIPDDDETKSVVLGLFEDSSSRALVWALNMLAENFARNDEHVDVIPDLYGYAIEQSPRPNVTNEVGAILLIRAGVEPDNLSHFNDVSLSESGFGRAEIISPATQGGPIIAEHRTRLLELALEAFAQAYGYCVQRAVHLPDVSFENAEALFFEACYALDGMRVVAQERRDAQLLELIYANYFIWESVLTHGGDRDIPGPEFARRFAYGLGLARSMEAQRAVGQAQDIVASPVRTGLVDEIAEAVTKAMRGAPAQELREAEKIAAALAGPPWVELPVAVRDQLVQAEYMERVLWHSSFDWAPVALPYFRAVELLLRDFVGPALDRAFAREIAPLLASLRRRVARCDELTMGEYAYLLPQVITHPRARHLASGTYLNHIGRLRDLAGRLRKLNSDYRRMGTHAGSAFSGAQIRDLKRLIFQPPDSSSESLLNLLADLRPRRR